ncbi:hypothetical protein I4F81_007819 [Pyropia yezoensis]|uniref:Uncharacterized protein n=1 Tax=Pyropia yezoensis TaxID=2788 RepID=A0ACC3C5N5_PYRYE|nr:hypothetical protein I4F81_007819 [Neopyropia yezoensis]
MGRGGGGSREDRSAAPFAAVAAAASATTAATTPPASLWGGNLRVETPADARRSLVAEAPFLLEASLAPPCPTLLARCSPAVHVLHPSSPITPHYPTLQATSSSTSATSARPRHHACRPPLLYYRCRLRAAVATFLVGVGRQRQPLQQRRQRRRSMR